MNTHDTFWLARYAQNKLAPIIAELPCPNDTIYPHLALEISSHPQFPGLHVWIHQAGLQGVVDYASSGVTKESIDRMAERLPAKWAEALDRCGVTA